ncbi:ubiquitin-related domain-containing protein [Fimicolochytrium jonesii]|uniref:ubiquitin-related domain-containing protein n=1 Tax=Fimicolochytrium jonesii TaxID=1396493 RepID=UPI0022FED632|nr:ubiquitin-related domain-containing protein [Fimicolochytrium jonesii]KAI8820839.1 ubiquitin-related domain-containing protein [Fimicolochytrium jonesii]
MPSDRDTLIDMGFSTAKVTKALQVTKNAGLQPAMDWLFAHTEDPDPTPEELAAPSTSGGAGAGGDAGNDDEGIITAEQATAQSLKCDDCGRLLRDATAAEMHAIKSGHQNFSESTDAIKPLTEEEKKAKLADIQARLAEKREQKRLAEIEENKGKEKIRRATGKEMTEMKERLKEKEMQKALEAKKKEKEDDLRAKARIRAKIEEDKKERARQAEERKLAAQGIAPAPLAPAKPAAIVQTASASHTEARLQIRLPEGAPLTKTFSADDTLSAVYDFASQSHPTGSFKLVQTFPRKVLDGSDRQKTLKELNLVPSAVLVLQG